MALQIQPIIDYLLSDNQSGSTELALNSLQRLHDLLNRTSDFSQDDLATACNELQSVRPSMIALANALHRWQQDWQDTDSPAALSKSLTHIIQQLQQAKLHVAEHAAQLVKHNFTVMTHSRSSQVTALFALLVEHNIKFKVILTLSAPGNEGLLVAQQLNEWKVPTTIITDAEMGLFMPEVDINISGCDSWLADNHFVNKSGTLLQALAAQHFGKPFWVLADSFKNSHQTSHQVTLEAMPINEMQVPAGDFIQAENIYFETISTRLISGRVDENGIKSLLS